MSSLTYPSRIVGIQLHVAGTNDIINDSFAEIVTPDTVLHDKPYPNGVQDLHLGTTNNQYPCSTCLHSKNGCLGHSGHLILNYPIQSPIVFRDLKNWLRLICFKCGIPVINPNEYMKFSDIKKLKEAAKLTISGGKKCIKCGTVHPNIVKDKEKQFMLLAEYKDKQRNIKKTDKLYPHIIKIILEKIPDEVVISLGRNILSHPKKYILNAIPIPPTTIRPDTKKGGKLTPSHTTIILQSIIRANSKIRTVIPDEIDIEFENSIYHLNDLYYEFVLGGTGKQIIGREAPASLAKIFKGKEGIFRQNLQGKRVKLVARSTITGDPTLKIDELGVPYRFAKILQVEEVVQEYNKKKLMINFINGRNKYPGCTKIIKKSSNTEYSIDNYRHDLEIGDILLRDLEDGDYGIFNRQPSLLPSNLTAMRLIICMDPDILTFRMNVITCPLFNADFNVGV